MYKIVVVDSDAESVSLMRKIIEKDIPNGRVVAVAASGNDAVIETINTEPDLILIDIRIMGMNGLEAIAKIRSFNPEVRIIIVSEYDYFEFAKRAMTLGVNDYLLKPLDEQTFRESVLRELKKVRKEEKQKREYDAQESQAASALRFVEEHFIYSIICNMRVEKQTEQYRELIGIGEYGYLLGVTIEPGFLKKHWEAERISNHVRANLKKLANGYGACAIGPRILNRYIIFVASSAKKSAREEQTEAIRLAKDIIVSLRDVFDIEARVSIGAGKPLKHIHESYLEMLKSYHYNVDTAVACYKESRQKNVLREDYIELTEKLIDSIKYDRYNMAECFSRILEAFRPLSSEERMTRLLEVLIAVSYEFRKELKSQHMYYDYLTQSNKLLMMELEEQEVWAYHHFNTIVRLMKLDKNDRKSTVITEAMEYIQKHYNEDISLNDISNYVNLSPQHFSKIFKEATNFNYVEWINNLRVTKAKEYMSKEDYTIKEVCYLVGYKDPNYFSRIFKKYVGISPTEYVKERAR